MTHHLYSMNLATHRIVPIVATQEMVDAYRAGSASGRSINSCLLSAILAAPQPEPVQSVTAERVRELVALFDSAAQEHGWAEDQGSAKRANEARGRHTQALSNLNAAIDQMALDAECNASSWRTIETAPKNKTLLLGLFNELGNWRTMRGQWFSAQTISEEWEDPDDVEEGWYETAVEPDPPNCWLINPTHWMPLPRQPEMLAIAPTPRDKDE